MDRYTQAIAIAQIENAVSNGQNPDSYYTSELYLFRQFSRIERQSNEAMSQVLSNKSIETQALNQLHIVRAVYMFEALNDKLDYIQESLHDANATLSKISNSIEDEFNRQIALTNELVSLLKSFKDVGRVKLGDYKISEAILNGQNSFLVDDDDIKYSLVDKYGDKLIAYKKIALIESQGQNPWKSKDADVVNLINLINAQNPPSPSQFDALKKEFPHLTFRNLQEEKSIAQAKSKQIEIDRQQKVLREAQECAENYRKQKASEKQFKLNSVIKQFNIFIISCCLALVCGGCFFLFLSGFFGNGSNIFTAFFALAIFAGYVFFSLTSIILFIAFLQVLFSN